MIYIDTKAIRMTKQQEDKNYVIYKFEFNVEIGTYLSKSGNIRHKFEPKTGMIQISKNCFNKDNASNTKQTIEILKNKTDHVFLNLNKKDKEKIIYMCLNAIKEFKKDAEFPDYAGRQI